MCIRDRQWTVLFNGMAVRAPYGMLDTIRSAGEVVNFLNLGIPGIMYVGGICGVIGAFFYEPVSYTHLDVYKRQAQIFVILF